MPDKLKKDGKPFPDMVFPRVMQSTLIAFDSAKYTPTFVGAMASGLYMVNPYVPNLNTSSPKTKKPTKLKRRWPVISKSPPAKMQTFVVSEKTTVVKRRRLRWRDEEEGDDFSNQNLMNQHVSEGISLLTKVAATLDSKQPTPTHSPKMDSASQETLSSANLPTSRINSQ